jgi:DNA-binding CsgD family transcriptional regulator
MPSLQERHNAQGAGNGMKPSKPQLRALNGPQSARPDQRPRGNQATAHPDVKPGYPPVMARGAREGEPSARILSQQEKRLVRLLAMGRTDKEIAGDLDIAEDTVSWHLRILYRDFDVHCRTALVAGCLDRGLVSQTLNWSPMSNRTATPAPTRTCS